MAEFYWAALLGEEEVPVWFLLYVSSFALFSALKMTLSVRTTVERWCANMALHQDASISLGVGENEESRGELPLCWSFFCIFISTWEFSSEPLWRLSNPLVILFSMSWENNWIGRTREKRIFVGKLCAAFHNVWLVRVQPVLWVSGDVAVPTSVRLRQTEPVACGLCESLLMSAVMTFARR